MAWKWSIFHKGPPYQFQPNIKLPKETLYLNLCTLTHFTSSLSSIEIVLLFVQYPMLFVLNWNLILAPAEPVESIERLYTHRKKKNNNKIMKSDRWIKKDAMLSSENGTKWVMLKVESRKGRTCRHGHLSALLSVTLFNQLFSR